MKLLIIRHGDPDYAVDSLTEKGWREASFLKERLLCENISAFYSSPHGRARDTAKPTLDALGRKDEVLPWLREFDAYVVDPESGEKRIAWDRLPREVNENPDYFDRVRWLETSLYRSGDVREKYDTVCDGLDTLLKKHGYVRDGFYYHAKRANTETIALFCHFGVECVLLSHLLNIAPPALWQGFTALTSSVTTVYTEEREEGTASFRCCSFGDLSHLYAHGEPPSFQARFCEVYSDNTRH